MSNQINIINHLVNEATKYLEEANALLNQLSQVVTDDSDSSTEDTLHTIELILQYRLSSEDALNLLLKIDHNVIYFLGIQPQHSASMNHERLSYALGHEDLKQILNVLAILTGSLSKLIARYQHHHTSFGLNLKTSAKQHLMLRTALKLTAKQHQFIEVLSKIDLNLEQLLKLEALGPVLDHIAGLRGPISQFHQALVHGMGQAMALYQLVNKTQLIEYPLHSLIKKTEEVLHTMPHSYTPNPTPILKQDEQQVNLEQRAAAKRLRPFFG